MDFFLLVKKLNVVNQDNSSWDISQYPTRLPSSVFPS